MAFADLVLHCAHHCHAGGMTKPTPDGDAMRGPVGQRRPAVLWRGWAPWVWLLLVAAAVLGAAVVLLYAVLIYIRASNVCDQPPDPAEVAGAQRSLAFLAVIAFAPWALASLWVRPRLRVLLSGALCASPACLVLLDGFLRPDAYSMSWCF